MGTVVSAWWPVELNQAASSGAVATVGPRIFGASANAVASDIEGLVALVSCAPAEVAEACCAAAPLVVAARAAAASAALASSTPWSAPPTAALAAATAPAARALSAVADRKAPRADVNTFSVCWTTRSSRTCSSAITSGATPPAVATVPVAEDACGEPGAAYASPVYAARASEAMRAAAPASCCAASRRWAATPVAAMRDFASPAQAAACCASAVLTLAWACG